MPPPVSRPFLPFILLLPFGALSPDLRSSLDKNLMVSYVCGLLFSLVCIPDFPSNLTFPDDPGHDFDGDNQTEAEGDCDDNEPLAYTGAEEVCGDLIDNDCNGDVDEYTAVDAQIWYADADGDGYGSEAYVVTACLQPVGYVAVAGDCDDTVAAINPGALELCTLKTMTVMGLSIKKTTCLTFSQPIISMPIAILGGEMM